MSFGEAPYQLVIVAAGTSEQSSSRMLANQAGRAVSDYMRNNAANVSIHAIELAPMAAEISQSLVDGFPGERVTAAIEKIAHADGLIFATPVYKAAMSGLFKSFIDLLDNDLLLGKPVLLTATGGSPRHAMVVDDHMRSLFAFMRALVVPTSLYATPDDWSESGLKGRVDRAAAELSLLMQTKVGTQMADANWGKYQHTFSGQSPRAQQADSSLDFDTDLMRLARGEA